VANVSYLQSPQNLERRYPTLYSRKLNPPRRSRGPYFIIGGLVMVLALLAAGALIVANSNASLTASGPGLANLSLPFGGGSIQSVSVNSGQNTAPIPVQMRGDEIWPRKTLPSGKRLVIDVVVRRPGWISWLSGSTEHVTLTTTTPTAHLRVHFLTLAHGAPLRLAFDQPIRRLAYGQIGDFHRTVLASPESTVTIPHNTSAGSTLIRAAPRVWESAPPEAVSWFPAGLARASAVVAPSPGARLGADEPITLTFSKPVSKVLGSNRPVLSPAASGSWHVTGLHSMVFEPSGYGYGLGATVKLAVPAGVGLVGGHITAQGSTATFTVPGGSTLRLQQLLAQLGYLPVSFTPAKPVANTLGGQLQAAQHAPAGNFSWRWGNVPAALRSFWSPGASGVMTRGAIMAFESDHGMATDGVAGPGLWKAVIAAAIKGQRSTFGYTFVSVSEGSPETETTWHNGRNVVHGLVNTGIPAAPTATGTFPVFEHLPVTTMSGTNPDGSHYSDPGIPWTSYFNGGDALHGFIRGGYGYPQSLGCVEMPFSEAHAVYQYTPIGTLVHVF
jgi:peptidoglycan hydrolase-like protein with peptidoglycan-binding domain